MRAESKARASRLSEGALAVGRCRALDLRGSASHKSQSYHGSTLSLDVR
jgi:hypothetical protein